MSKINSETSYILGALRDATFDIRKSKNYELKIAQKEVSWLRYLQKIFRENFEISGNITKHINGTEILRIHGRKSVEKIFNISEMKIPQEYWDTPSIIKKQNMELQFDYLCGFFDAEGGLPKDPLNAKQRYISFSQKNKESLIFIRKILVKKKFRPTNLTFCGNVWEFRLTRKNDIIDFCSNVRSFHKDKIRRLKLLKRACFPQIGGGALPGVERAKLPKIYSRVT